MKDSNQQAVPRHGAVGQHWKHKVLGTTIVVVARAADTRIGWPQRQVPVWIIASLKSDGTQTRRRRIRDDNLGYDYVHA